MEIRLSYSNMLDNRKLSEKHMNLHTHCNSVLRDSVTHPASMEITASSSPQITDKCNHPEITERTL